jgi:agmatinase
LHPPKFIIQTKSYEGCKSDFAEAQIVLFGAGYDGTSSYRSGSRFAPTYLRSETYFAQEDYSPYFQRDMKDRKIHDLGDVEVIFGNTARTLQRIEKVAQFIVKSNKIPVCMGGEHLITLPIVKVLFEKYPELHIIQLDAHLDVMDELIGERYSHGTVIHRIYDLMNCPQRIYQVGIRSGSREEYQFSKQHLKLFPFDTKTFLPSIVDLKEKPVYLTIDLDVFDPSLIPGTGTPEAGGISFQEYIHLLGELEYLHIVGADVVELAPQIDPTNVSTIVASKILRELLLII